MGEDTEELRREIEETRANISRDVDALTYKASPSRMVSDRVEKTKSGIAGVKDKVFGSAGDATGTAQHKASSAAGSVQGAVGSAQESVSSAAGTVQGAVTSAPEQARQRAQGNPLAAGLIAFGVGWLVSSLLPVTEAEERAADKAKEAVKDSGVVDQAKQAAQEVGEALKEPAQQAVESVKSTAQEGVQQVKDTGQEGAQQVKETGQQGVQEVRDQGASSAQNVRNQASSS